VNDATRNFIESISGTIKGLSNANFVVEHENLSTEEKAKRKRFLVFRYDPSDP
jgi:hypothetical protein